jgi:hypothetical protein
MAPAQLQIPDGCHWVMIDAVRSARIADELRREIGLEHPLFQMRPRMQVIAACEVNDDVLAITADDENQLLCIHLTWSGKGDWQAGQYPAFEPVKRTELYQFFFGYRSKR